MNTLAVSKPSITPVQRAAIEAEIIDDLIYWKKSEDKRHDAIPIARAAILRAKELKIWESKFTDFKTWLAEECEITEAWAYKLMNSAKMLQDIKKIAGEQKRLDPLNEPENKQALEQISERAADELKKLPTAKAAMAALNALQKKKGQVPTVSEIKKEIVALIPPEERQPPRATPSKQHPILLAFDQEWELIKLDVDKFKIKPEMVYTRLRVAVEDAL